MVRGEGFAYVINKSCATDKEDKMKEEPSQEEGFFILVLMCGAGITGEF